MPQAEALSCYVLTHNSASQLGATISSLQRIADEILIVDSGSTDRTKEIAIASGTRFLYREFCGFSHQRTYAASQCRYDWVLSIDSDEVVTDALADRILELKHRSFNSETTRPDAFGIRREWYLLGQQVHCFYPSRCPDQPIRLFRKGGAMYSPSRLVHENMVGFNRSEAIDEPIAHYTCNSIDHLYSKLNQYSTLAAADFRKSGGRSNFLKILLVPWLVWFRWYVIYGGWKDGRIGLIHGRYVRDMVYQKYLKARHDFGPDQSRKSPLRSRAI